MWFKVGPSICFIWQFCDLSDNIVWVEEWIEMGVGTSGSGQMEAKSGIYREGLRTTTYYVTQDNRGYNWY